jgi:hypothetical protein
MESVTGQGLMDLPSDWWRSIEASEDMARCLRRHLLGLWIRGKVQGDMEHEFFTGFLLDYRDTLLWITAGHVIDRINEILSNQSVKIGGIQWVDQCNIPNAGSIPISHPLCRYSATEIGIDFGAIKVQGLEADIIRASDENKPLTEQVWRGLDRAHPEGYYVFGYPKQGFETDRGVDANGREWGIIEAKLACLPVERIEFEDRYQFRGSAQWWNKRDSFFGQIRPFTDDAIGQIEEIEWMSGAPVFSVEREPGGIRYRLVGIQSSWVKKVRQIRAEPIHRIVSLIDDFLMQ